VNLPNKLTVLRIILVPFFVFFLLADFVPHRYLFALIIFCAASYTDHLDGKIARRDHLITNFGKLMDPLADKILVVSALICLVKLDLASTVCVLLIMIREFAITSVRMLAVEQGRVIAANNWGKAKTVSQMVAIIAILLMQYIGTYVPSALPGMTLAGQVLIVIATFFTVVSGVIYIKDNRDVMKG
jgi:CDP-diacylglycerol--glycerol-3-phosphate 3-phosphatidyltransferase